MGIDLDLRHWPAALVKPPPSTVSDGELQDFLSRYREQIGRRKSAYATVVDLRGNPGLTPTQRRTLATYIKETEQRGIPCVATALVFDSVVLRSILTAIFWLRKPAYPVQVFATAEEAIAWSVRHVAASETSGPRAATS